MLAFGDLKKRVSRMAVGTGAVTRLPSMMELRPDVILAADDGFNWWDGGLWAADSGMPLLMPSQAPPSIKIGPGETVLTRMF